MSKATKGQIKYRQSLVRRALKEVLAEQKFLFEVLTLPEVCEKYNKSRSAVLMAINTNRLIARKAEPTPANKGGAWLILKSSCDTEWKSE